MQILLHSDIIKTYLARQKNEVWYLIRRVVENEKSKIVLTKKLLECWENAVGAEYFDAIQALLMEWQAEQHLQYEAASETKTCEQEFEHLAQSTSDLRLPFAIAETSILKTIKNISFLEKIRKPNKDWLLFEIAANQPSAIIIRRNDCSRNADIENIFKALLNFPFRNIKIFDRLY